MLKNVGREGGVYVRKKIQFYREKLIHVKGNKKQK